MPNIDIVTADSTSRNFRFDHMLDAMIYAGRIHSEQIAWTEIGENISRGVYRSGGEERRIVAINRDAVTDMEVIHAGGWLGRPCTNSHRTADGRYVWSLA